jgi:hypothetical protein
VSVKRSCSSGTATGLVSCPGTSAVRTDGGTSSAIFTDVSASCNRIDSISILQAINRDRTRMRNSCHYEARILASLPVQCPELPVMRARGSGSLQSVSRLVGADNPVTAADLVSCAG